MCIMWEGKQLCVCVCGCVCVCVCVTNCGGRLKRMRSGKKKEGKERREGGKGRGCPMQVRVCKAHLLLGILSLSCSTISWYFSEPDWNSTTCSCRKQEGTVASSFVPNSSLS